MPEKPLTLLLADLAAGREGAMDALMRAVEADLIRLADAHLRRRAAVGGPLSLEPAALLNETYLRLIRQRNAFQTRGQFFAIVTRLMLRVLADYRRERRAAKREARGTRITLTALALEDDPAADFEHADLIDRTARVIEELESRDPRKAAVVRMRVLWGLELDEIATSLDVSPATVDRDWRFARAWLLERLGENRHE